MLLKLDAIREALDEQFLPLEPVLTGFRMVASKFKASDLKQISNRLGVNFTSEFEEVLLFCDLGNLTIGPVVFGNGGDYEHILYDYNIAPESKWWSSDIKPNQLILVAVSDPYSIALACESGEVVAFLNDETVECGEPIASDFKRFICGIGTVFVERNNTDNPEDLGVSVAQCVNSKNSTFWLQLAK